ncbi:hypothetical protein BJ912DRAFT_942627 [Pholiota molesta]|nr:hypothetical protein BJ912DRAFT_942627 [Pholiota molesta]
MQNANDIKNEPALPIGDTPFWEEDTSEDEEGKQLKSVPESYVLLRSLKQSRDRWLYHTFPKFSTKTRGNKAPEITQPHILSKHEADTILYEVNYLASQVPAPSSAPVQNTSSNPYWQSTVAYRPTYSYTPSTSAAQAPIAPAPTPNPTPTPTPASVPIAPTPAPTSTPSPAPTLPPAPTQVSTTAIPASTPTTSVNTPSTITAAAPESERVPTPLISSLTPISAITPGLISQVNAAASANPTLAHLLQLAAAGDATQDQLKTLGLLIQSLAALESATTAALAAKNTPQHQQQPYQPNFDYYQRTVTQVPIKPFDLVIEFRETPGDRWLFPRGSVYAERTSDASTSMKNPDVVLTTSLSNDGKVSIPLTDQLVEDSVGGNSGLYKASLRLKEAPLPIWDMLFRWIGGSEQNEINKKHLENLVQPKRFYPSLRLPPGPLLTQVQNASGPSYTMKLLRHGPTPQSRAARNRKPYAGKKTAAPKTVSADGGIVKKPRASQSKPVPTPIQCVSCKQTDVPLILGGRYCRPCVDAGKNNTTVSQNPDATSGTLAASTS